MSGYHDLLRLFLVNLEGVDEPVGFIKGRRVVLDVVFAGVSVRGAGTGGPDLTGPVTAEGYIEDLLRINSQLPSLKNRKEV